MESQRIKIEPDLFDKIVLFILILSGLLLFLIPAYYFSLLPEIIPIHYNFKGKPDGYGNKNNIWLLSMIGNVLAFGLYQLTRHPALFNYPENITRKKKQILFTYSKRTTLCLAVVISFTILYLVIMTVQVALNYEEGLSNYFSPIFLVLLLSPVVYYIRKSLLNK
ncbi:DUF1648 domain-containing protein [Mesonia ostreae]|uniref:DUF1648 domain-containing protein n=1 Tax=Mesonia ostreae TaxID=861110 RepID=A0ABU2KGT7_9FLAO|nr:DUF1648 domain-containing protein [Mesonia ostreae]MDT0293926.1 DUF1648 domain-containing protein [Mesonia ostreae]